jgi:hypothetical protein
MRLPILLTFFPILLSAQSAFLKDPDIVWAAEIEQDWVLDIPSLETEWEEGITTLKLLRTEQNESYWSSPYLADLVFQAALAGELPVFKDAHCKVPMDANDAYPRMDTIVTFDPETYEEKISVVYFEPEPHYDIKFWRLRQVLAYHKKSARWSTTVQSIAPMIQIKNPEGDSIGMRPLFWFRPDGKRQKLSSKSIVWAKETRNKQTKTQVPTDAKTLVKVSDGFQFPVQHQLKAFETDFKTPFYGTVDEKPLSQKERTSMVAKSDTVITFDPESYEEKAVVVNKEINPYDIRQLRLVQIWYWDERRARLSICLDAVGLLKDEFDDMGNFKFSRLLFYRKRDR